MNLGAPRLAFLGGPYYETIACLRELTYIYFSD